jgi:hypothetical protein
MASTPFAIQPVSLGIIADAGILSLAKAVLKSVSAVHVHQDF